LSINNQVIALDRNGVGSYTATTAGIITATATAIDINGNTNTSTTTVSVIDPTDTEAPDISLKLIEGSTISTFSDIIGTVNDTNLDYYKL
jgi:hypothetical protein